MNQGFLCLYNDGSVAGDSLTKGTLTFAGMDYIYIDSSSTNHFETGITFGSFTRGTQAILDMTGAEGLLGNSNSGTYSGHGERVQITTAARHARQRHGGALFRVGL